MPGVAGVWRSIRPKYNLIGSKCSKCGKLYYPPRELCECGSDEFEVYEFKGTGKIVSYTVIHVGATNFDRETPYPVAIVELDEGVRTMGQIVKGDMAKLRIGAPVRMVFRKITEDGKTGVIQYGYKFEIVEE